MSDPEGGDDRAVTIVVVRTGGFAGRRRHWQVDAVAADAEYWRGLVAECPWEDEPCVSSGSREAPGSADRFVWSIRARTPEQHDRDLPESALTGPWRALVDAVREASSA
ncbi:protealysin inhibitor emfourin [Microbacterium tumbae]